MKEVKQLGVKLHKLEKVDISEWRSTKKIN